MLGSIGMPELVIIFVIALVVFGPRRLPELGRSLGRTIAEFKRASADLQDRLEREVATEADEQRRPRGNPEVSAPLPHSEFSEQLSRSANGDMS
jgi:sec-independent protein translocase protein TatA